MKKNHLVPAILKDPSTWLYPSIEPHTAGHLRVSQTHEIYYEESGNPKGKAVVFLHGGPGSATGPKHRQFFHPEKYRIILFDQRGCGNSRPFASLEENTTWDLVDDMEKLRTHLRIDRWQVFGGSWGSTLALAYAETHPDRVSELILRGIFLLRKKEIDWTYQFGAHAIFPEAWEDFVSFIPEAERSDMLGAYHKRIHSSDAKLAQAAAKAWTIWEGRISKLIPSAEFLKTYEDDHFALSFARIESHYFLNNGFMRSPDELIEKIDRIRHIPAVIAQGRYDIVCPIESAWDLHKAWPEAELQIVPDAGHSVSEGNISRVLVAATDKFTTRV